MKADNLDFATPQPITAVDNDVADLVPELPIPGQRWTVRRKATVVTALRGGWVPVEEISRLYEISADEIVAWERDLDRHGIPGLRSTRLQIYRDTEKAREARSPARASRTRFVAGMRFR